MIGSLASFIVSHLSKEKKIIGKGVLISSGLVAGDACMGVIIALLTVLNIIPANQSGWLSNWFSIGFFALLAIWLCYQASRKD